MVSIAVLSRVIPRIHNATPNGGIIGRAMVCIVCFVVLHIVSTTVTGAVIPSKNGAVGTGSDSLAWLHIPKLGTATVFAHDAVVDDHIDGTFHNLVIVASRLSHDTTTIELAYQSVVDAPSDVALNALFESCGDSAETAAIDIAVWVVVIGGNTLIETTSEIEAGEVAAEGVDSAVPRLIVSTNIDMCTWRE